MKLLNHIFVNVFVIILNSENAMMYDSLYSSIRTFWWSVPRLDSPPFGTLHLTSSPTLTLPLPVNKEPTSTCSSFTIVPALCSASPSFYFQLVHQHPCNSPAHHSTVRAPPKSAFTARNIPTMKSSPCPSTR